MDCAGLGGAAGDVERAAARRATDLLGRCDVAIVVFDARRGLPDALRELPPLDPAIRKILAGNKIDLMPAPPAPEPAPAGLDGAPQVFISARKGWNVEQLEGALLEPYRAQLKPCEEGGPVAFTPQVRAMLERIAALLHERGPDEALREVLRLSQTQ